jgi:tRNA A37 methylthiotransferase MiaB
LGIREVTLLGQNVNSYRDSSETSVSLNYNNSNQTTVLSKGFKANYKIKHGGKRFSDLLDVVSKINPEMRIR